MIKKLTFILLAAGCTQVMYAQSTEKNEKFLENKTLFEELTNVKKNKISSTYSSICRAASMQTSATASKRELSK